MRLQWRTVNQRTTMQIMTKRAYRMLLQTVITLLSHFPIPVTMYITITVLRLTPPEPLIWHTA